MTEIKYISEIFPNSHIAYLCNEIPGGNLLSDHEKKYIIAQREKKISQIIINRYEYLIILIFAENGKQQWDENEKLRKAGFELCNFLNSNKIESIQLSSFLNKDKILFFAEGLSLSNYDFSKYKSDKTKLNSLKTINIFQEGFENEEVEELKNIVDAVKITRDLVNEPVVFLTAEQFSKEMSALGKEAGFEVEIFNKKKIESLKMGGLLAVNWGSPNPPTFNILSYKPANAINEKPIVLVGKGVVYDTGGLSLKETTNGMDYMKMDMAGGAAVVGSFYAIAKNNLPLYLIGLIPATENRPDGNAVTPGDVIEMHDGTTVEVLNTDAEGRLILADALSYAKKYEPELVIDLATLTGSAARAIGKEGIVFMGTASDEEKNKLKASGENVYERLVEFPLWDEYAEQIKSAIADLKNIGGPEAGAITAGKFLEHFTSYPWFHFDIAGGAYTHGRDSYRGLGGTGLCVRLLYDFLKRKTGSKK